MQDVVLEMKICILCFGFNAQNINRQPWRYIFEVAKNFTADGIDVKVISNGSAVPAFAQVDGVTVRYVDTSDRMLQGSRDTLAVLREENPDAIIVLIGLLGLLKRKPRLGKPTIAILTSPIYDAGEVLRVALPELLRHTKLVCIHLLEAILPRIALKHGAKFFDRIIVLSARNRARLAGRGLSLERVDLVKPGIREEDLVLPSCFEVETVKAEVAPDGVPFVLYFGAPLTLRGTDTLIQAFAEVADTIPSRLVIMSRIDDASSIEEHGMLQKMVESHGLTDRVVLKSAFLSPSELKKHICAANVVCLPFKLVTSDVPITILEAMALGKPIVSTCLDGIPELLEGRGIVVTPGRHKELAKAIVNMISNSEANKRLGERARDFMLTYPRWQVQSHEIQAMIEKIVSRRSCEVEP
jgi:glycosyltransferase involved in cell wall biosynthesis